VIMTEYIPKLSTEVIESLLVREFSQDEIDAARRVLNGYSAESIDGRNRVLSGMLKLSEGDLVLLEHNVEIAMVDFRDIVAWAESPNLSKDPFHTLSSEDKSLKTSILRQDYDQYQNWLNRKVSAKSLRKILKVGLDTSIRGRGISLVQALSEVDFDKHKNKVTVDDLRYQIDLMPEVIDEWFSYSEDKRTSGGWYLLRDLRIGTLMDQTEELSFSESDVAVANYVIKELNYWNESRV